MKMVRSDLGASGVIFTLDTETRLSRRGLRHRRLWPWREHRPGRHRSGRVLCPQADLPAGLSRGAARGAGRQAAQDDLRRRAGGAGDHPQRPTSRARARAVLPLRRRRSWPSPATPSPSRTTTRQRPAEPTPMDIEWAKDGDDGSSTSFRRGRRRWPRCARRRHAPDLCDQGLGPSPRHRTGGRREDRDRRRPRRRAPASDLGTFRPGEVLVADTTTPGLAAGDEDGRGHRHQSRRAHLPRRDRRARTGRAGGGRDGRRDHQAPHRRDGDRILRGRRRRPCLSRARSRSRPRRSTWPPARPKTEIMVNLGDPDLAFHTACCPAPASAWRGWSSSSRSTSASIPWRWPSPTRSPRRGPGRRSCARRAATRGRPTSSSSDCRKASTATPKSSPSTSTSAIRG